MDNVKCVLVCTYVNHMVFILQDTKTGQIYRLYDDGDIETGPHNCGHVAKTIEDEREFFTKVGWTVRTKA